MFSANPEAVSKIFKSGIPPKLLYVTRQEYGIERPMHSHDTICELALCYTGTGIYHLGSKKYPVKQGDLIFYNAGLEHELIASPGVELGAYCLGFSDVDFVGLPRHCIVPPQSSCISPSGSQFTLLREMAERILEFDMHDSLSSLTVNLLAVSYLLLAKCSHTLENEPTTQKETALTSQVKDYISAHLSENIVLQDIADHLCFSPSYISHVFKKETGYSSIEYLIRRRIGYAETLLISSDYSVTHIATLCGYDSPNHFQVAFKKIVGTTPLQYRKKYLASLYGSRKQ